MASTLTTAVRNSFIESLEELLNEEGDIDEVSAAFAVNLNGYIKELREAETLSDVLRIMKRATGTECDEFIDYAGDFIESAY